MKLVGEMQELNLIEIQLVSGGEAGVPHSDYYYDGRGTFDVYFDRMMDWICRGNTRCAP